MNKKTLTILGIAILVVIAIGFWFAQKNKTNVISTETERSQSTEESENTVIPTEEETQEENVTARRHDLPTGQAGEAISDSEELKIKYNEDGTIDTSDWRTYRNEEHGFEVIYPNMWSVSDMHFLQIGFETFDENKKRVAFTWTEKCMEPCNGFVEVIITDNNYHVSKKQEKLDEKNIETVSDMHFSRGEGLVKMVIINGVATKKNIFGQEPHDVSIDQQVIINDEVFTYTIGLALDQKGSKNYHMKELSNVFDEFLKSFRFL